MANRKTERISIRVSEEEKEQLRKNSMAAGYENNLSGYLIDKGMEQNIPYAKIMKVAVRYLSKELEELKRIDQKIDCDSMEAHGMVQRRIAEVNKEWLGL